MEMETPFGLAAAGIANFHHHQPVRQEQLPRYVDAGKGTSSDFLKQKKTAEFRADSRPASCRSRRVRIGFQKLVHLHEIAQRILKAGITLDVAGQYDALPRSLPADVIFQSKIQDHGPFDLGALPQHCLDIERAVVREFRKNLPNQILPARILAQL